MRQVRTLDFSGQHIFCGIDVHKKNWAVSIRDEHFELKTYSHPPDPATLAKTLHNKYPGASFLAVYEAGFCGFWIQRQLEAHGISCIVINPADLPITDKDRQQKTDPADCRRLARMLCHGQLQGIYIPPEWQVEHREVMRTRKQFVRDQTRIKNRIHSFLNFHGIPVPSEFKPSGFTRRFVDWLEGLDLNPSVKTALLLKINSLKHIRQQLLDTNRYLRQLSQTGIYRDEVILIRSIPGIGLINAMLFLTEIGDIERFKGLNQLCNYFGLTPNIYSSGDTHRVMGLTHRCNHMLREALLESAWVAMRKDPALLRTFQINAKRMHQNKAIIKVAKKLLSRIRYVLLQRKPYVHGVVQ